LNPRSPKARDLESYIDEFKDFCLVDLELAWSTTSIHLREIRRFVNSCDDQLVDRRTIRRYLLTLKDDPTAKRKALSTLKRFFRDYLNMKDLVSTFKFPSVSEKPKIVASTKMINAFFNALPCDEARTTFLFYATSGLRRNEVLALEFTNVDFDQRMIIPSNGNSQTKRTWITFYNRECEEYLKRYCEQRDKAHPKLFQFAYRTVNRWFETTKKETGINITPQRLREWFCCELGNLGVQDRYVDAFCGRTPKSVLARHYTDYCPERLKRIYDRANLKVLS